MTNAKVDLAEGRFEVSIDEALGIIDTYPLLTLQIYDGGGRPDQDIPNRITPRDIGRLIIIEPLQQAIAIGLLQAEHIDWDLVPLGSRLEGADPDGDQYAKACELYALFVGDRSTPGIHGVGPAIASKVLHLKRPGFFPILDSVVRSVYQQAAHEAYQASALWSERQPTWKHLYWAAIRNDLVDQGNCKALDELRGRLSEEASVAPEVEARRSLAVGLGNLRLMDILAWHHGKGSTGPKHT